MSYLFNGNVMWRINRKNNMNEQAELYKMAIKENMVTVVASALCVGCVAIGTGGSLHCFWGLVILINLNTFISKNNT
jgi:hypothetical protein